MEGKKIATLAVHAGSKNLPSVTEAKVAPIYASSVWSFESLNQLDEVWEGRETGYIYSRMGNPTVHQLEQAVSQLEGGESAAAYGSGTAAIAVALMAGLNPGDHVVAHQVLYGGIYALLKNELAKFGIETSFVDFTDLKALRAAMKDNTRVLYLETICNPLMEVADIPEIAAIAHAKGSKVFVDNTFASPVHCRPLELGADVVMHSATKYLCGHSDVTAGAVIGSNEFIKKVKGIGTAFGPTLSPFDAWLVLRGIKTLALRMERHSSNALALAKYLIGHPKVTDVHYPGLTSSTTALQAQHVLTGGYGGMLSFTVAGGLVGARAVIDTLEMAELAPSLAGTATTTSHPGKTSHRSIPRAEREEYGVGDGLVRVSVGIEDIQDIIADFTRALSRI